MTPEELEFIQMNVEPEERMVKASDFQDGTLLYGYTLARDTFHVYVLDGMIHRIIYKPSLSDTSRPISVVDRRRGESLPAGLLFPSKRAYPDQTLFGFAKLMKQLDVPVCYTSPSNREGSIIPGKFTEGAYVEKHWR